MLPPKFYPFLKIAALCSILGALTTSLLLFLPNPSSTDFEANQMLYENNLYLSKLWILFLHPQFNFIASLGIALLLFKKYPARIIIGTLFLGVWAYTEMTQQALLIDALNQIWRPAYLNADSGVQKTMYETLIKGTSGFSDSKYFVIIYGFGFGSLLFGWAMINEKALPKWIGIALILIGVISLLSFSRYYLGFDSLSPMVNGFYKWIYPYLQPLVRIGIGVWIFQQIRKR
jgi:glucan phosphoethanolaminetransferase (alkaline phosphatase superfamily)